MWEALQIPFFQRALLAGLLASLACGIIGSYVVVKRISTISGGLSHAAFGGVGLGYWLGFPPLWGAVVFALATSAGIGVAYRKMRAGFDTLISMIWSVGMALGLFFVALKPGYAPDLMSYLFGSILFVPSSYLWAVLALDLLILAVVSALFKELQAVSFDEEYAEVVGLPVAFLLQVLLLLTALCIVTLIRVVGVILVIALLTIPAATARHWTDRLSTMMLLASLLGALYSTGGLFFAWWLSESFGLSVPSGPLIILLAALVFALSGLTHWGLQRRR